MINRGPGDTQENLEEKQLADGKRGKGGAWSSINHSVPEIIDRVFAKTSQNARFLLSENERFGLVFVKTGSINSGTVLSLCEYVQSPITVPTRGKIHGK
jgi:hypothetical protein